MESLTCTQERLLKLREEKRSWLERLRELERDTSQLPTEQSLDKQVFERKKEYYQSTSEARAVETQWNRWHRHKMDALEKGRPGHALSAVRKCRRMRHLVSLTKQDAITKEYRLRSAMSEQASRGVKAFGTVWLLCASKKWRQSCAAWTRRFGISMPSCTRLRARRSHRTH